MKILGIETSCDETAVAVVSEDRAILANEILSQIEEHSAFGGVVPEIAARAHLDHLGTLVKTALAKAGCDLQEMDAIAATAGPGLIGGLIVGVTFAKTLAMATGKPFIAVNHLEAHALTARLTDDMAFPYLLLLVSGGHTQLLLVEAVGQYRRLGGTIDDAAGEAFDKIAKLLGLGFPGGPALERAAATGDATRFPFSMPLAGRPGCDFSFSGLKTAARQLIEKLPQPLAGQDQADMAASFQAIIARILADRCGRAISQARALHPNLSTLVVAGGVAANGAVRTALAAEAAKAGITLVAPPARLCTDNAAMVAWAGLERFRLGQRDGMDFAPRPRWPLMELAA
jgi:N6-L-threonylcarbamoyladenine synthase